MLKLNKTKKLTLLAVAVFAIALFLGPVASSTGDNVASAHKSKKCDSGKYYKDHKDYCKKHDSENHGEGNLASQVIKQVQSSIQNAQCVSGGNTQDSCNNISTQNQQNSGNNALGQQQGDGSSGDNLASQVIKQVQSSIQNAQCVSGGNTQDSCNNISTQNQQNSGNNALGQQQGDGSSGDNLASQGIGQFQSSIQNSQVVSGGDTEGSGNNINLQNQLNTGNNALAQQ